MSRNPISFIFSLGKHQPLPIRPLIQLNADLVISSSLAAPVLKRKFPVHAEQERHSNQMSS